MNIDITVGFTPRVLERFPALAALHGPHGGGFAAAAPHLRRGDQVVMQGAPTDEHFVVAARLWELMNDEATLTILLGLADEVPL